MPSSPSRVLLGRQGRRVATWFLSGKHILRIPDKYLDSKLIRWHTTALSAVPSVLVHWIVRKIMYLCCSIRTLYILLCGHRLDFTELRKIHIVRIFVILIIIRIIIIIITAPAPDVRRTLRTPAGGTSVQPPTMPPASSTRRESGILSTPRGSQPTATRFDFFFWQQVENRRRALGFWLEVNVEAGSSSQRTHICLSKGITYYCTLPSQTTVVYVFEPTCFSASNTALSHLPCMDG